MAQKMDKNSLIGFALIGLILIGYTYFISPSKEERQAMIAQQDSLKNAEAQIQQEAEAAAQAAQVEEEKKEEIVWSEDDSIRAIQESAQNAALQQEYGRFGNASVGENEYYTLENDHYILTVSSKGGRPISAQLKNYNKFDGSPLFLFDEDSSQFAMTFKSQNRLLNTADFYFKAQGGNASVSGEDQGKLAMRLYGSNPSQYIEYVYAITGNSFDVGFTVNYVGLDDILIDNNNQMPLTWQIKTPAHEKGFNTENIRTSIFYKEIGENRDYISERSAEKLNLDEELEADLEWIAFKQQFFTVAMMTDKSFIRQGGSFETVQMTETGSSYIKDMIVDVKLPVDAGSKSAGFTMFLGPNDYAVLKSHELDDLLDFGWGLFGFVGEWFVRPIFSLLGSLNISYGIVILLLTLMIKLILSPLTYKSYLSGAKMKVLKPELTEINEKFKDADPLKKQQEVMGLYRKAGVNPMAGCIPMLLQMPILYAMFMFFPTSIELRGESFLWADDLATYDSIFTLPFEIPFYGQEVSLFTLLMAGSMFFYTRSNMASGTMGAGNDMQAQQMKIMMYFMPVMMLFFFNSYPAGLSYYYLCANVTSIGQNWAFRKFLVNEEAIHAKVQENKKKPKKKSKFQQRMEDIAKQKGIDIPKS